MIRDGIATMILESPFYGMRRPREQVYMNAFISIAPKPLIVVIGIDNTHLVFFSSPTFIIFVNNFCDDLGTLKATIRM